MTARECYEKIGADYDEVVERLGSEALVVKFIKKFPGDKSFALFREALDAKQYEEAFRAIHTLKGVAANLSLTRLYEAASVMTEDVRGGVEPAYSEHVAAVCAEYEAEVALIEQIDG